MDQMTKAGTTTFMCARCNTIFESQVHLDYHRTVAHGEGEVPSAHDRLLDTALIRAAHSTYYGTTVTFDKEGNDHPRYSVAALCGNASPNASLNREPAVRIYAAHLLEPDDAETLAAWLNAAASIVREVKEGRTKPEDLVARYDAVRGGR